MRFALLAIAAVLAVPRGVVAAETKPPPEPDTYIFDLLPLQPYKASLARLVASRGTPEWVKAISSKGEGTAVPSRTVDIAGTPYRLDHVCKPHDCAGNTLDVLWAPAGHKVWAALVEGGKTPVMLGNPPAPQAKALADATTLGSTAAPASTTPAAAAPSVAAPLPSAPAPVTAAATPSAPPPEPDTYIFDVLAVQPYKGSFARLVKAKGLPDWVAAISIKGEGTAVPSKTVDVGGTPYRLDHVCKPHDCAGHTLDVLWAPRGTKVWAALVEGGKAPVMLGEPKGPQAKALMEAMAPPAAAAAPAAPAPPSPPVPSTPPAPDAPK